MLVYIVLLSALRCLNVFYSWHHSNDLFLYLDSRVWLASRSTQRLPPNWSDKNILCINGITLGLDWHISCLDHLKRVWVWHHELHVFQIHEMKFKPISPDWMALTVNVKFKLLHMLKYLAFPNNWYQNFMSLC